jgi:hypothetical protein
MSSTGQVEQGGLVPVQMCLPNGTSKRLMSIQCRCGSSASSASRVFSGVDAFVQAFTMRGIEMLSKNELAQQGMELSTYP